MTRSQPIRIDRSCGHCGRGFTVLASRLRHDPAMFCSVDCARAARILPPETRFWAKVDRGEAPNACWTWTGSTVGIGHGRFWANGRRVLTHRFSWEMANGPIPAGLLVCHHCDNPPCVNPAHLFLGTDADNSRDCVRKGRLVPPPVTRGERRWNAKLTAELVRRMRGEYADGATIDDLAPKYGVDRANVWAVVSRQTWKHVE